MIYLARLFLLLGGIAWLLTACGTSGEGATSGSVLFQDDFSNTGSGWDRRRAEVGFTDYENGGYRIQVATAKSELWATPRLNFGDVRIDVDATKQAGPDDNDIGVICRYQNLKNFYFLTITSDGYYGIVKMKDGQPTVLGGGMKVSEQIGVGNALNHLRADCVGAKLTLSVNGHLLDTQQDSEYTSGDVGLIAGTFGEAGVDIWFDNFTVLKP